MTRDARILRGPWLKNVQVNVGLLIDSDLNSTHLHHIGDVKMVQRII
jgi:hypothetical protein